MMMKMTKKIMMKKMKTLKKKMMTKILKMRKVDIIYHFTFFSFNIYFATDLDDQSEESDGEDKEMQVGEKVKFTKLKTDFDVINNRGIFVCSCSFGGSVYV